MKITCSCGASIEMDDNAATPGLSKAHVADLAATREHNLKEFWRLHEPCLKKWRDAPMSASTKFLMDWFMPPAVATAKDDGFEAWWNADGWNICYGMNSQKPLFHKVWKAAQQDFCNGIEIKETK